ncbi:hydrolase [Heyndrickxia camelliae]|uniref:Hydrolase n=1 Tax=Heyndrickxia camelliae TaxID=1707093 RepID=A0A2N3LE36_9BACI|nr:hydrolase [Heyndrickxia camelliae]PKR82823.1 hydrolase [Heyndrickxia camelliae]
MKKKERLVKKENVIYFPGLPQRLLTMGIEQLENKNFEASAKLLMEAKELSPDSAEIETALLVAFFEMGNYLDAKSLCEDMLNRGIGEYFEIIDIYLMVLIQLKEYKIAAETINALIEEKEVPHDKLEHYEKLLQFSQKRSDTEIQNLLTNQENDKILTSTNIQDQILEIAGLMNVNIHPYVGELTDRLSDSKQHPFIQTMILNLLKEHGIEKKVLIEKFHYKNEVVPTEIPALFETPFYMELMEELQKRLEQENPSMYEQIKTILDKHFFLLYPFELKPANVKMWMAGYHTLGYELYGESINIEKMSEDYQIMAADLNNCLTFLHHLEEISLPIL